MIYYNLFKFFSKDYIDIYENETSDKKHQISIKYIQYQKCFRFDFSQILEINPHAYGLNSFWLKYQCPTKYYL